VKQAVVLAGGKGTRLRSVLGDDPKPLATVSGRTILGHQLDLLVRHGFDEAVLLVSHGADRISAWLEDGAPPGLRITLVADGEPRGTAGAVLAALDHLAPSFAVLYADTMLGVDLSRFYRWHAAVPETAVSLFLHPNDHPQDSDLVEQDSTGRILRFHPYPHPEGVWLPNLVNAALYMVNRDALLPFRASAPPIDFGKDLFPRMLQAGALLRGYVSPEYIKDAGTPARLDRVRRAHASGAVARASLDQKQNAVFIDRDGTLNQDIGHISSAEQLEVFSFVGPALRRLNEAEWRAIVVTNQPVLARGETDEAGLQRIHARLDSEVAQHQAYFDRLFYCPHHPDAGFAGEVAALKQTCTCRKPAPGMLLSAAEELNVSLPESWLIGDSTADLGAAELSGVSSILVETGSGGLDDRYPFEPGFGACDFAAAVSFILDAYPSLAHAVAPMLAQIRAGEDWFIGGLARSGKSTLAATLARELRMRGLNVAVIQLDRWLLSEDQRRAGVLGRYEMTEIESAFQTAQARRESQVTLSLPVYSRRSRARLAMTRKLALPPGTVVLWEGTVALELARLTGFSEYTIQVETDSAARRTRFDRFYRLRGLEPDEISAIWASREGDEYPVLGALGKEAAYRVNLDTAFARLEDSAIAKGDPT
jgi:D,D-heptose 1,7-bisphosphate phosphatase